MRNVCETYICIPCEFTKRIHKTYRPVEIRCDKCKSLMTNLFKGEKVPKKGRWKEFIRNFVYRRNKLYE